MDVCLPEEFLRLTAAEEIADRVSHDEWLGAEAWVTPPPAAANKSPRKPRTPLRDDPTWRVI
jgi:hypothetical protein